MSHVPFFVGLMLIIKIAQCQFNDPEVDIWPLLPKGFKVSIKQGDITFFGWRGNINREFDTIDEGQIKADVPIPGNGTFTFINRSTKLNIGDVIYFWTYIIYTGGMTWMSPVREFIVTQFFNPDGTPVNERTATTAQTWAVPSTTVKVTSRMCALSATVVREGVQLCAGDLIFSDDFDSPTLSSKWDPVVKFPLEPDFPYNLYSPNNGTLSIENGNLVITPKLTDRIYSEEFVITGSLDLGSSCVSEKIDQFDCVRQASGPQILPPVATAKVNTKRTFNFKFGKVEVRAKMPSGDWLLPEINLEPTDVTKYALPGLMRVAFVRGNDLFAKRLHGGPVLAPKEPFRSSLLRQKIGVDSWNKDYHVYTMIWKPDGIELLVDGKKYGSVDPGEGFYNAAAQNNVERANSWLKGSIMAPFDDMFHLSLGLRVGGINDFEDMPQKPWRNTNSKALVDFFNSRATWSRTWETDPSLKIDYIRVYAL